MLTSRSIRVLICLALALLMSLFAYTDSLLERSGYSHKLFLIFFIVIFFIWEVNTQSGKYLGKKIRGSEYKRTSIQILISLIIVAGTLNLFYFGFKMYSLANWEREGSTYSLPIFVGLNAVILLLFFLVTGLHLGLTFLEKYRKSQFNEEKLKKETTQAQLESLKIQVNPHFLFNNLSIMGALIEKDSGTARLFLEKFSEVYRSILLSRGKELVTLQEEIEFLSSYLYLLEKRFGENLRVEVRCTGLDYYYLPPLCLQLLIENCIKHNIVSIKKPLQIKIINEVDRLTITNNLQKKEDLEQGTGFGLKNIKQRYTFFTDRKVEIIETDAIYMVTLPLLKMEVS